MTCPKPSTTTARRPACCAASSGASRARSKAWPPTRGISTSRCRPARLKRIPVDRAHHVFAYVFAGSGTFRDASGPQRTMNELTGQRDDGAAGNRSLVLFDRGDEVTVQAGDQGIRFLLVSGRPIEEPVAWVRADRDEHAAGAAAGHPRTERRHLHPEVAPPP